MKTRTLLKYFLLGLTATVIATCLLPKKEKKGIGITASRDYAAIKQEGVLRVATEYNSISFHASADSLTGFHYELITAFAEAHGLKTEIIPEMSFDEQLKGLAEGKFDVIANGIQMTSELKDSLLLTQPVAVNKDVLVQRKPVTPADSAIFVRSQLDLAGKTLHVVKGSPSMLRIHNLGTEIADTIYIKEVEKYGAEQLIAMVAHGDIDYAVCEESTARAALDSLPQLDIHTDVSFRQFYAWAVSKQSPALCDSLNHWLKQITKTKKYRLYYKRYFSHS